MTDLAQRAENNLFERLRVHARAAGGSFHESPALFNATAPANIRAFNQIVARRFDPSLAAELRKVVESYAGRKTRLTALEHVVGDHEQLILGSGLQRQGGIPSLALTSIDIAPAGAPLEIREVEDEATLADHVMLVSCAFDFVQDALATVFTTRLEPAWSAYVGYVEDEPVATTQLVAKDGVAGLYYVGTLETHRGRGYGDAITRHAIIEGARLGCDIATLQASPSGYPVYKKIGFEDVGYYLSYLPAED
jgi:ribosomal protein S18 acetylase RimI-like enzyme